MFICSRGTDPGCLCAQGKRRYASCWWSLESPEPPEELDIEIGGSLRDITSWEAPANV